MKIDFSKVRKGPTERQIEFIVRNKIMDEDQARKLTFEEAQVIITNRLSELRARRIADALDDICAPGGEINGQDVTGFDWDDVDWDEEPDL